MTNFNIRNKGKTGKDCAVRTETRIRNPGHWGFLALGLLAMLPGLVRADPVPKGEHNRDLTVRLNRDAVVVSYRLDVEPFTAYITDLGAGKETEDLVKAHGYPETFERVFASRLATGLDATLDTKPLAFACTEHTHQIIDPNNHIRFVFVFRAPYALKPGVDHRFTFREGNFLLKRETGKDEPADQGQVKIALLAGHSIRRVVPRLPVDPDLSSEEKARRVGTIFRLDAAAQAEPEATPDEPEAKGGESLVDLLFDSRRAFWILLALAAFWGAIHAFSPGHGKTLVAAYLVGERGTVWHAFLLGLVTTLTHTGAVLVMAVVLRVMYPSGRIPVDDFGNIQRGLELGSGLLVAALGFWLLFCRLAGKADHVHFGGGHHHGHHHHHHDHTHDHTHSHDHDHAHGHTHVHPVQGGWRGLVALGISGGLVPCPSAVVLLLLAVVNNNLVWALPLLLAFSAGLAGVLVMIGILVVKTKALAGKRWERSRLFGALPVVSAVLVAAVGLGLCYKSLHDPTPPPSAVKNDK